MNRDKIEKLHDLVDFVHQLLDGTIVIDKENLLLKASGVFNTPVFLTFDQDGVLELLKDVCTDTLKVLDTFYNAVMIGYQIRYDKPVIIWPSPSINQGTFSSIYPRLDNPDEKASIEVWAGISDDTNQTTVWERKEVIEYLAIAGIVFDLIEDMPIDRLKRCLECERLFVQQTARTKKYCSDYCKNKRNLRIRGSDSHLPGATDSKEKD